ncbi:hypothetical protein AMECASPLE_017141 [Ameca splendens]|uniref:Uncharacterized protein n=1 Tax=Ameca splendens TaxID=208324 RepID=A0ABV1AA50_9TELE
MSFRCFNTSCSKDFMITDVGAMGLYSSNPLMVDFLCTGMMVEHLKQDGTSHSSSDLLKISVKMGASWPEQALRHDGEILSNMKKIRGVGKISSKKFACIT